MSGGPAFVALGGLRAWIDGREADLGARQPRLMTALLLARAGAPAPVSELTALLWSGDPPPTAVNVVHRHIGAIRRALEPTLPRRAEGRWLFRSPGGYRLILPPGASDLSRFRTLAMTAAEPPPAPGETNRLVASEGIGRFDGAEGFGEVVVPALRQALALWTGRFAEGLGADGHPLVVAVNRERTTVAVAAADATLVHGRPADAEALLPPLSAAVDADPLDEPLLARLLLVLAAAGRPAEAVDRFHHARERLTADLGVTPGPELTAAVGRILRPSAPPPPAPARGSAAPTSKVAYGSAASAAEAAHDPVVSVGAGAPIPPASAHFTGRLAERSEMSRAVDRGAGVLALDGMPGVGKTALAVYWAHEVAERFPDGRFFLDLRGTSDHGPRTVGEALAGLLGGNAADLPSDTASRAALWQARVAGRRMLILLDDACDADQVRPLLPAVPGPLVLVTSRGRLILPATPGGTWPLAVGVPSADDAARQLLSRLGIVPPGKLPVRESVVGRAGQETPSDGDGGEAVPWWDGWEGLGSVLERTGRLPLALAVVAARRVGWLPGPARVLADLAETLRLEPGLDAFADEDPASDLRTLFGRSYRRLSSEGARELRGLGRGPATVSAELAGSGLLTRHGDRYTMHELVREFVEEL